MNYFKVSSEEQKSMAQALRRNFDKTHEYTLNNGVRTGKQSKRYRINGKIIYMIIEKAAEHQLSRRILCSRAVFLFLFGVFNAPLNARPVVFFHSLKVSFAFFR
ncbi:MAG: hypothetical protein IKS12_04925 [Eubacterium sp.]|nr:hypothetical protein [Eubacterium sp.]MBR7072137.1 hypothetical protein [Eubacterium sp.]